MTLAKALANGLPIGALLCAGESAFAPGDHGSTFGGNPVACAAACAVVDAIDDALLANVRARARAFDGLAQLPGVAEVRGAGLLIGIETERPAGELVDAVPRAPASSSSPPARTRCASRRRSSSATPRSSRRSRS